MNQFHPARWRALLFGAALLAASVTARAESLRVYADIEGWAYSEPVPVTAFADDWKAPLDRGSDGLALLHAESGVRLGNWRVGWALQRQYAIRASRGTAELYHLTRNGEEIAANQRYDVDLDANYYEARGLRLGRTLPAIKIGPLELRAEPSLMLWEGIAFEDGRIEGQASTDEESQLTYAATLNHAYSEDVLLDRTVARPSGRGASLDLDLHYALASAWSGELHARNLLGRMWWHDAPYTLGVLGSDTRQTGDDGLVRFAPTLTGFEGMRSHRQRLPLFAEASLLRHFGPHALGVTLTHTEIGRFHGLQWTHERGPLRLGLQWLPDARDAVQMQLAWRALRVAVGGSDWRWDEADQLHLRIGFELAIYTRR